MFNYKLCPQVSIGWFPSYTARHINKVFYFILSILFYSILQFFLSVFLLVTVCWPRPIFPYVVHAHSSQIKFAFSLKIHGVIHPSDGVWKILPNSHNTFLYFHFLDHYVTLSFLSTNSLIWEKTDCRKSTCMMTVQLLENLFPERLIFEVHTPR